MKGAQRICKEKALKIITMTVEKLFINKIKNKAIVLLIKQKIILKKCNTNRGFNLGSDSNVVPTEISMANKIKEVTIDYLGIKDTPQTRITQIKISFSNNNKKWECQGFTVPIKEDAADPQNQRRRIKITNSQ